MAKSNNNVLLGKSFVNLLVKFNLGIKYRQIYYTFLQSFFTNLWIVKNKNKTIFINYLTNVSVLIAV